MVGTADSVLIREVSFIHSVSFIERFHYIYVLTNTLRETCSGPYVHLLLNVGTDVDDSAILQHIGRKAFQESVQRNWLLCTWDNIISTVDTCDNIPCRD